MNRILWKLQQIGERLWIIASITAQQAAALGNDGRGFAVVAEETRNMTEKMQRIIEGALFDNEEINKEKISDIALQINFLAVNSAIEAFRLDTKGKQAAVCADEIRDLAYEIVCLFDEALAQKRKQIVSPWAADPSSAARNGEFLLLNVGGMQFVEPLANIREVYLGSEHESDRIMVRNMELPLVDIYKMLDIKQETLTHVILWTPWAEQNKTYAVTADVSCLFFSPIGKVVAPPADMPLAQYVRECWENENGEPFYFMDWPKMSGQ